MPSYTVTTSPQNILNTLSGITTLTNNGPATIYIDSSAAVSPINGFPLLPTASMTWQSGQNIWVVTKAGTANLISNPAGNVTDKGGLVPTNTLGHFGAGVMPAGNPNLNIGTWETSAYQTMYLNVLNIAGAGWLNGNNPVLQINVQWLASDGTPLTLDTYYGVGPVTQHTASAGTYVPNDIFAAFPVKGSAAQITLQSYALATAVDGSFSDVIIYADNRVRPVSIRNGIMAAAQADTWVGSGPFIGSGYGAISNGYSGVAGLIFLDPLGKTLTLRMVPSVAGTVEFSYMMPTLGGTAIVLDSVTAGEFYTRSISVLPGVPIRIDAPASASMFAVSWDDDNPLVDPYFLPDGSTVNGSPIISRGDIQTGTNTIGSAIAQYATVDVTETFPVPFDNPPLVFANDWSTYGGVFMVLSVTTTGFTMRCVNLRNASANIGYRWIAIPT